MLRFPKPVLCRCESCRDYIGEAMNKKVEELKTAVDVLSKSIGQIAHFNKLNYYDEEKLSVYIDQIRHISEGIFDLDAWTSPSIEDE